MTEERAELSSAEINDLPDSAFAYIEPGGKKDSDGKTVPRSLRHFPIHDEAHVRNALARAPQSPFGDKAMPKIKAAAKKFGIGVQQNSRRIRKPRQRAVPLAPEVRLVRAQNLEVRDAGGSGDNVTVSGMVVVYNTPYTVVDQFGEFEERMHPGVATDVIGGDVRFLIDHDPSKVLARTTSGTLTLKDEERGLRATATLDLRDTDANNLLIRLERGDVNQMSAGFVVGKDSWNESMDQRDVYKFSELLDTSAVTYPASPTTSLQIQQRCALRMQVESRARLRKFEADLRAGKSLSSSNSSMILQAVQALHNVLDGAGLTHLYDKTEQAVEEGTGSPEDNGKGNVLPEEPVDGHKLGVDNDGYESDVNRVEQMPGDNSDGLAAEPLIDPGEQIREDARHASAELLADVMKRRGARRTAKHRESSELLRQAKARII